MNKENNILVIDDEEYVLSSIKREFRDASFGIVTTTDPNEAMEILDKGRVKVVMSDQRMAKIPGVEFLAQVREKNPDVIRILFTGYSSDSRAAQDAVNVGRIYRFINKPWETEELRSVIDRAIKYYDLLSENRSLFALTNKNNEKLVEVNDKLTKMLYMQREFAAITSHEIRTPLAAVKSTIDLVLGESTGKLSDEQKAFLNKVHDNVNRLNRLINNILDLIKLESGEVRLDKAEHDLKILVQGVVGNYQKPAQSKGLILNSKFPDGQLLINVDADKICQVLSYLVDNAVKFTKHGRINIFLDVHRDKNILKVCVEDTGRGIHEGDAEKIFQKFKQFGKLRKHVGGTGLELAICQEIIRRHNGKIWVESEYGKGSRFYFTLPLNAEEAMKE